MRKGGRAHQGRLLLPGGRLLQAYRGGADREPRAPSRHRGVETGRAVFGEPASQALSKDSLPAHISHWIAALERSQASDSEDYPPDAQNRLLYVFSLPVYRHAPSELQVEAVSARILKNGGFSSSVSRPELSAIFSETPAKYIRPSDVKIARLLSAARGHAYGAIRLKDEAAWEIIEPALATGRARLDNANGMPLVPGPVQAGKVIWKLGDDAN